jgi:hypothetical protein
VRHLTFALVLVLSLFVIGCDSDSTPAQPTPTPAPTPAPTPTPTPTPAPTSAPLTGTVSSTTGQRIGGATVTVIDGPDAGRSTVANGSGEYRFDSLTISNANFRATASGFGEDRRGTFVNGTNTLNFTLAPANASLAGTVRSAAGERLPNITLAIVEGADRGRETSTGSTGEYRFDGLNQGTITVRATGTGYQELRRDISISGATVLDFFLDPVPQPLTIVASPIAGGAGSQEWGFEARGTVPPSIYTWDFGDGGSVDNGREREGHVYEAVGDFVVRVIARPIGGGTPVTAEVTIMVRF